MKMYAVVLYDKTTKGISLTAYSADSEAEAKAICTKYFGENKMALSAAEIPEVKK